MTAKETYKSLKDDMSSRIELKLKELQALTSDDAIAAYKSDVEELSVQDGKYPGTGGIRTFITGRNRLTYDFIDLDKYYIKDEVDEIVQAEHDRSLEADEKLGLAMERLSEALATETAERIEEDQKEHDRSVEADEKIGEAVAQLREDLTTETNERKAADEDLQNQLNNEISRAEDAEKTLLDNIDAEKTRAESAESDLQSQITLEIADRKSADTTLLDNIDSEVSSRKSADSDLQSQINSIIGNYITTINASGTSPLILNANKDGNTVTITGSVDLSSKQDVLTAGTGIDITDNVIICTLDNTVFKVVETLPTSDINTNIIYIVTSEATGEDNNLYPEYIYVNDKWEKLGEFKADTDLSNYYTKSETYNRDEIDNALATIESSISPCTWIGVGSESLVSDGSINRTSLLPTSGTPQAGDAILYFHIYHDDPEYVYVAIVNSAEDGVIAYTLNNSSLISIDLSNYYTKDETYNKDEVNSLIDNLDLDSYQKRLEWYTEGDNIAQITVENGGKTCDITVECGSSGETGINLYSENGAVTCYTPIGFTYNGCEVATQCWVGDNYYSKEEVDNKLTGITGSIDLSDYYKKEETYNKEEVDDLISAASSGVSSITVTSSSLTVTQNRISGVVTVNIEGVDLSDYYTKEEIDEKLSTISGGGTEYKLYSETENSAIIETPDVGYGTISTMWDGGNANTMTITTNVGYVRTNGKYLYVNSNDEDGASILKDGKEVLTEADISATDIENLLEYYDYNNSISTSITGRTSNVHILDVAGTDNVATFSLAGSRVPVGREMYWIIHNTGTGTLTYQFGASTIYHHICVDGNTTLTILPDEYGEFSMISDGTNGYIRSASQS